MLLLLLHLFYLLYFVDNFEDRLSDPEAMKQWESVKKAASNFSIEADGVNKSLPIMVVEREKIATTEIGNMVAIPHGANGVIYENKIAIGILKEPISWDIGKVRLIIMLALDKEKILDYEDIFSKIYKRVDSIAKVISICENKSYEKFIKLFK